MGGRVTSGENGTKNWGEANETEKNDDEGGREGHPEKDYSAVVITP